MEVISACLPKEPKEFDDEEIARIRPGNISKVRSEVITAARVVENPPFYGSLHFSDEE